MQRAALHGPLFLYASHSVPTTMTSELRVALLGQGFMGKAHSNAYCQAGHFYDLPYRCGARCCAAATRRRSRAMAARWGWEETATDWRAAIDRPDIDVVDIALPNHLHAPAAIAAAAGRQDRLLREAAGADGRGRRARWSRPRAACRRWSGSTTAACRRSPTRAS